MLHAIVAGAGPAGSSAALLLARAGKRVHIYERTAFPRSKACGEYLSFGAVRLLHELGVASRLAPHARPVRGVRLHGHGVHARIDFPNPGWSVPRSVLDSVLLEAALQAGATLVQASVEACSQEPQSASVTVRMRDGSTMRERADALLGCDGIHSLVARKCGLAAAQTPSGRFALGGHYRGFAPLDDYIDMYVDGRTYLAINPLGEDAANVMLVLEQRELAKHRDGIERFAQDRARRLAGDAFEGVRLDGKRIAIGPLAYGARRLGAGRVLLAGDAARFIDPFTGQGVYLAMRCAQIAAECVLSGRLAAYEPLARREIAARERASRRVRMLVRSPLIARTAGALARRHPRVFAPLVQRVTGTV